MREIRRGLLSILGALVSACLLATPALAAIASDTGVVRSYTADSSVRQGMIVALSAKDANKVEPLTSQDGASMLGVAISPTEAPITVAGDGSQQIYVATSGQYNVLVSTENGTIHAGDYISISSLNGVGMKADDAQPTVLGRAASDLSESAIIEHGISIKTVNGVAKVSLGILPVTIIIASNPNLGHGTGNLPGFIQIASSSIAARPVAASRVYMALAVLLLAAFISAIVLYSGIRSGIVSIGRNPLARHSILGGIIQAVSAGVVVFILGLIAVYLLLRL